MIVILIIAFCAKRARKFPIDLILMLAFVMCFSYIVSFCCSAVANSTDQPLVPIAIATTVAIALALTLYAFLCKGHWKLWLGILLVCCSVSFVLVISSFFVRMPAIFTIICCLGVLIYGIYLVFVTKMVIGGEIPGFPMDAPIIASLLLYIYITRIFLMILGSFGRR